MWVRMGEVGKLFAALKERAIAEIAMVGAMTRPGVLRFEAGLGSREASGGAQPALSPRRQRSAHRPRPRFSSGRAFALSARMKSRPSSLPQAGRSGPRSPSPDDGADIAMGAGLVEALSPFDAGQGAVVAAGRDSGDRGGRRHGRHARPHRGFAREQAAAVQGPCRRPRQGAESAVRTFASTCRQ